MRMGNPPANAIKFFCAVDLLELSKDRTWLAKLTNSVNQHWHKQNARKKNRPADGPPIGWPSLVSPRATAVS